MPFAADTFDLVTSFDMLQCIPTDREAVREMARVVKPGGAVVISMAALPILHGDHSEVWREYRRYTRATARALAEQAGLRVERVSYMFASLVPLMIVTRGVQRLTRPYRGVRDDTDITIPAGAGERVADGSCCGQKRRSRAASRCRWGARCWWWRANRGGAEDPRARRGCDL